MMKIFKYSGKFKPTVTPFIMSTKHQGDSKAFACCENRVLKNHFISNYSEIKLESLRSFKRILFEFGFEFLLEEVFSLVIDLWRPILKAEDEEAYSERAKTQPRARVEGYNL